MDQEKELLPCPFCEAPARMLVTKHIPSGNDFTPQCTDPSCAGRITKKYMDRRKAADAWNKRSAVKAPKEQEPLAPLTMKELQKKDGEPVWVVVKSAVLGTLEMWALVEVDEDGCVWLTNNLGGRSEYCVDLDDGVLVYDHKTKENKR